MEDAQQYMLVLLTLNTMKLYELLHKKKKGHDAKSNLINNLIH